MSIFDEIGKAASDFSSGVSGAVEDAGRAIEGAASDAGRAIEGAASDAGRAIESAASDLADEAARGAVGAVVGTVLLGPLGGVVGAAIGASPLGEQIEDAASGVIEDVVDMVEGIPAQLADGVAEVIVGKRGLDDVIKGGRINLAIVYFDNDPRAVTPLKPGEETTLVVTVPALAGNSNVKRINAILAVADASDDELPPPTEARAKVSSTVSGESEAAIQVTPPRRPLNVSIRLDGGAPFWTHAGPLTEAQYTLPDFSAAVNEFLDSADAVGEGVQLRFLVKSATAGRVGLLIGARDVDATRIRLQTWTNELDRTVHIDRSLSLDFASLEEIPLTVVDATSAGRAMVTGVSLDVAGSLGSERVLGEIPALSSTEFATVSAEYAVGQRTQPGAALNCTGVTGCFQAAGAARVYVELQPDEGGVPAFGPPLAHAEQVLPASPRATWTSMTFEKPATIAPSGAYWIVVRGIEGEARLVLERGGTAFSSPAAMSRGGQRWQAVAPSTGTPATSMLRLVYLPDVETASAALDVRILPTVANLSSAPLVRQRIEVASAAKTVSLRFNQPLERAPLNVIVRSHARGTVTLTNITQEYTVS